MFGSTGIINKFLNKACYSYNNLKRTLSDVSCSTERSNKDD